MEEENDDENEQEFQFGQNDNSVENQYVEKFFCESYLVQEQSQFFFDKIIPFIADLALQSEFIFPESFLLLTQTSVIQQQNVQLTRLQVASLMSLMFLCANHLQQSQKLPEIFCFAKIFEHNRKYDSISKQKTEKLMFLFSYFQGLMELDQNSLENEQIIFIRQKIEENQNMDFWKFNSSLLTQVNVYQDGEMDDIESMTGQSGQYIKTIFANKNIGGSVMDQGMIQEEIFWLDYPELFVQRIFIETLLNNEAIQSFGLRKFSVHQGYAQATKFIKHIKQSDIDKNMGEYQIIDKLGFCNNYFTSIDAINFSGQKEYSVNKVLFQFEHAQLLRELNKSYAGFKLDNTDFNDTIKNVVTGNWGCGAFNGYPQLKFLIQWIACAANQKNMDYFTFEHKDFEGIEEIIQILEGEKVSKIIKYIIEYRESQKKLKSKIDVSLFDYIINFSS